MPFYKVCFHGPGGSLTSPVIKHTQLITHYAIGEWAYPPYDGVPLAAYTNAIPARILLLCSDHFDIFACEVENPRPIRLIPNPDLASQSEKRLRELWAQVLNGTASIEPGETFILADPFVVACDAIKLVEQLPRERREWL
jgi:hypothetical protein